MVRRRFLLSLLAPAGGPAVALLGALAFGLVAAAPAAAQESVPLFRVNENTTVSDVGFRFRSTQTFSADELAAQIATEGPTFLDKVYRVLPLVNMAPHPFAPIELQRDVARLRNYYQQNGFLKPKINYSPTVLDTSANAIDVVFSIEEGPPLIIQDVTFLGPDSTTYAGRQFTGSIRERWNEFRDNNDFRLGERYTQVNRTRIESGVLEGLKNRGFAFARTGSAVEVDSSANTADLRYFIDAGPRARIDSIQVSGNESVSRSVVLRELPFQEGDWFSAEKLTAGQRELFGLQLFRVALAQVPEQPRDSTVTVRYNVREASLRYLTAEGGYSRVLGLTGQGSWTHRNFLGDARELSLSLVANTGAGARVGNDAIAPERRFRASASVRQPYLFTTKLSAVASVFAEIESNPQLDPSDRFLDTNAGEIGLSARTIYEIFPYRTASLEYELARSLQFRVDTVGTAPAPDPPGPTDPGGVTSVRERDAFNKSILTASATLGRADEYVRPTRGFLVRPFVQAGLNVPLQSGTEYLKAGGQLTGYQPVTDRISVAGRVQGGRVWLYGRSGEVLGATAGQGVSADQFSTYENRFDPIYYYAGGASDVRGWIGRLAGPKIARRIIFNRGTSNPDTSHVYEAVGGRAKMSLSAEVRMPFPGLGENWGTAAFLDAGQVWGAKRPVVAEEETTAAPGQFALSNFRYGTGLGLRYRTPVGYLRLDLAYKINPGFEDLRGPKEVYEYRQCVDQDLGNCSAPDASFWHRLRLHLSIGQSF